MASRFGRSTTLHTLRTSVPRRRGTRRGMNTSWEKRRVESPRVRFHGDSALRKKFLRRPPSGQYSSPLQGRIRAMILSPRLLTTAVIVLAVATALIVVLLGILSTR